MKKRAINKREKEKRNINELAFTGPFLRKAQDNAINNQSKFPTSLINTSLRGYHSFRQKICGHPWLMSRIYDNNRFEKEKKKRLYGYVEFDIAFK